MKMSVIALNIKNQSLNPNLSISSTYSAVPHEISLTIGEVSLRYSILSRFLFTAGFVQKCIPNDTPNHPCAT